MKRIFTVFCCLALLTGCSGRRNALDALSLEDTHVSYPYDQSCPWDEFLQTESADYFVRIQDNRIYFCPKGTDRFLPLCGKPNCMHTDENCNAWVDGVAGLGYDRGRLYMTVSENGEGRKLISMALDGEDRRTEADIPWRTYSDGSSEGPSYYLFHGGKLFFYYGPSMDQPYEEQFQTMYAMDLETGEITRLFEAFLTQDVCVTPGFRPVGDRIYGQCDFRDGQTGQVEPWLVEMDTNTDEVRKLLPLNTFQMWYVAGSTLCYWDTEAGFLEYDLTSGETVRKGKPVDDAIWALRDDRGIYLCGNVTENWASSTFYFFDLDYHLVDQIDITGGLRMKYADSDYYYFGTPDEGVSARLAKDRIGSGGLALEPMVWG